MAKKYRAQFNFKNNTFTVDYLGMEGIVYKMSCPSVGACLTLHFREAGIIGPDQFIEWQTTGFQNIFEDSRFQFSVPKKAT